MRTFLSSSNIYYYKICEPLHVFDNLCGQINLRAGRRLQAPAVRLYSGVMESEAVGLFTIESITTFARRCG